MILSRFLKLNKGAEKTRQEGIFSKLTGLFAREEIDDDLWDELELLLIQGDLGVKTTDLVLGTLRDQVAIGEVKDGRELRRALQRELVAILESVVNDEPVLKPGGLNAVLIVGVNGVGKTTSIGKLGHYWRQQGHGVVLAAADTFRAAAIDQLKIWADRARLPVVAHQPGADPGAVVFDAVNAARARNADVLIVDTAGRLHTKSNLMEELRKIRRVLDKQQVEHVTPLLVLDATIGQNAISQAKHFIDVTGLYGVVLAKLDGTAKGGVVFANAEELELPVVFVGTGEQLDDLSEFDPEAYVSALFQ